MAGAGVEPMAPGGSGIGVQTSVAGGSSSAVPLSGFISFPVAGGGNGGTAWVSKFAPLTKKGQSRRL